MDEFSPQRRAFVAGYVIVTEAAMGWSRRSAGPLRILWAVGRCRTTVAVPLRRPRKRQRCVDQGMAATGDVKNISWGRLTTPKPTKL